MGNLYFQVPDARTGTGDIDALRIFGPPEALQRLLGLLRLPARTPPSEVYAQLSAFQRQHGLTPDGACGALTLQLLHDDGAPRWSDYLSAEVLGKLFPHTLRRNLQTYAPYVLAALDAAGEGPGTADGRTMCQVALATIRAETEGFEPISEGRSLFNTEAGGREFGLYDPPGRIATRLGNTQPGDGATFKGRGFVQLTGRDNYTRIGQQLALPLGERAFLANLPEGLASAAGLREEKRSAWVVFGLWGAIAFLSGLAAMAGPGLFADLPPPWLAFALGFSSGAVLCMLVDTLIPEAFETTHAWTGLITLAGFMTAFTLNHLV